MLSLVSGGGNWSTRQKPPPHPQVTSNFLTCLGLVGEGPSKAKKVYANQLCCFFSFYHSVFLMLLVLV